MKFDYFRLLDILNSPRTIVVPPPERLWPSKTTLDSPCTDINKFIDNLDPSQIYDAVFVLLTMWPRDLWRLSNVGRFQRVMHEYFDISNYEMYTEVETATEELENTLYPLHDVLTSAEDALQDVYPIYFKFEMLYRAISTQAYVAALLGLVSNAGEWAKKWCLEFTRRASFIPTTSLPVGVHRKQKSKRVIAAALTQLLVPERPAQIAGQRNTRTLTFNDVVQVAYAAMHNSDVVIPPSNVQWNWKDSGTVARSYNYPAITDVVLCVFVIDLGLLCVGIGTSPAYVATPGRVWDEVKPWYGKNLAERIRKWALNSRARDRFWIYFE